MTLGGRADAIDAIDRVDGTCDVDALLGGMADRMMRAGEVGACDCA